MVNGDTIACRAWATIDLDALQHNFRIARDCKPDARILAVVKANAYGHGLEPVSEALAPLMRVGDSFGVASVDEALRLRRLHRRIPILLLQGVASRIELEQALDAGINLVIHAPYQLEALARSLEELPESRHAALRPLQIWLKLDTGMHRLGMTAEAFLDVWRRLDAMDEVEDIVLMSHLARADELSSDSVDRQLERFHATLEAAPRQRVKPVTVSLAASGGTLAWPWTRFDWLRPGIMLYGGSSIQAENGPDRGLRPVMTLRSRLIAINHVPAGESIGYGATYTCDHDRRVGVVSIGYGDGYPRHAPNGTPVLVSTPAGPVRTSMIGRVSMDMVTIDVTDIPVDIGTEVILWGEGLPADEIARLCGTISYELFCQITGRVHYEYLPANTGR